MTTTPRQAAIALLESIANARSRESGINLPPHHSLNYHDDSDECWAWLDMWSEQVKTDPECTIREQVLELLLVVLGRDHTKLPHTEQHEGEQDGQTTPG